MQEFAMKAFQVTWTRVLEDRACEATSFEAFKGEVRELFKQISSKDDANWRAARERVKNGAPLDAHMDTLRRVEDDLPAMLVIEPLERASTMAIEPLVSQDMTVPMAPAA